MASHIERRKFLATLGGAAAAWPLAAGARQRESIRQVAVLIGPAESDVEAQRRIAAFRERMQGLGWVDGRNVRFEYRWGGGDADRIAYHAAELIAAQPDVIMANSTPVIAALKRATATIPIVFAVVADPVGDGFVASLSRPGGNITGFSSFDPEIGGKWVQLLKEVAPAMTRVALLFNPRTAPGGGWPFVRPFVEAAARSAGVEARNAERGVDWIFKGWPSPRGSMRAEPFVVATILFHASRTFAAEPMAPGDILQRPALPSAAGAGAQARRPMAHPLGKSVRRRLAAAS